MPEEDRREARNDALEELRQLVTPTVDEARGRGHVYFDCLLDVSSPNMPIRLQFADGQGAYYEKSLGVKKVALKHGLALNLADAVDFNAGIRIYVRGLDGIKMLDSGMKRRRLRAVRDS